MAVEAAPRRSSRAPCESPLSIGYPGSRAALYRRSAISRAHLFGPPAPWLARAIQPTRRRPLLLVLPIRSPRCTRRRRARRGAARGVRPRDPSRSIDDIAVFAAPPRSHGRSGWCYNRQDRDQGHTTLGACNGLYARIYRARCAVSRAVRGKHERRDRRFPVARELSSHSPDSCGPAAYPRFIALLSVARSSSRAAGADRWIAMTPRVGIPRPLVLAFPVLVRCRWARTPFLTDTSRPRRAGVLATARAAFRHLQRLPRATSITPLATLSPCRQTSIPWILFTSGVATLVANLFRLIATRGDIILTGVVARGGGALPPLIVLTRSSICAIRIGTRAPRAVAT